MSTCPRSSEVAAAASDGRLPQRIAQHVLGCDRCAEELLSRSLERWNRELSDTPLADPIVLWWKGAAARNAAALERATRPVTVVKTAALAIASLGAAGTASALWVDGPGVASSFEGLGIALGAMGMVMIAAAVFAFRRA